MAQRSHESLRAARHWAIPVFLVGALFGLQQVIKDHHVLGLLAGAGICLVAIELWTSHWHRPLFGVCEFVKLRDSKEINKAGLWTSGILTAFLVFAFFGGMAELLGID